MVDVIEQRRTMVESQIRPSDISDRRITRAMLSVARERFLPRELRHMAYIEGPVQLPTQPGDPPRHELPLRILAKLIQAADVGAHDVVLDVGGATGYAAALLSKLAETVLVLEEDGGLARQASETLASLSIDNVAVVTGPLTQGYAKSAPYDVILLEGAVAMAPDSLLSQLKDGGRLVAIQQEKGLGRASCWRRQGKSVSRRECFDAFATYLPGFEQKPEFTF